MTRTLSLNRLGLPSELARVTAVVIPPGIVDPAASTVATSAATTPAGTAVTITVTVVDTASGAPVVGATVVLSASGTGNTLTQPGAVTDANGQATGTLASSVAEAKVISATANGVAITDTAALTVEAASGETLIHSFEPDTFADLTALLADSAVLENYRENAGGAAYGGAGEGILTLEAGGLEGRKFARILYADTTLWTGTEIFGGPAEDRTQDYTNRLDINTPEAAFRSVSSGAFRLRRNIRFSDNFQTVPSWGEGAPDHKVWRIFAHPVTGLYWSLKIGAGVTTGGDGAVKFGHPASSGTLEMVSTEFDVNADPEVLASTYWDNAWHSAELRVYGLGTTAGITEWYLDDVLVFRVTGQDYTAYTGVDHYLCYANKNSGQSADITMDVDRVLAYRIDA